MRRLLTMELAFAVLIAVTVAGFAVPFQQVPPTTGLYRATAYTLRGREWQIGTGMTFLLLPLRYGASSFGVEYGLTHQFQVGMAVAFSAGTSNYIAYGFAAKLRLNLGSGLDLGFPLGAGFHDRGAGIEFNYLQGGAVTSIRMGALTIHGGAAMGHVKGQGWYVHPYASADFDVLPNLKLVGEVVLVPLSVAVGAWARVLDIFDVKLALMPVPISFTAGLYLRF